MKHSAKVLSAVLSCTFAVSVVSSASFVTAFADDVETANIYDNTISAESKEVSDETETTAQSTEESEELTTEVPFNVFDIYNAHMAAQMPEIPVYRQAKGIDVSQWQPTVDWNAVKASGIEFAIIRSGYGKYVSQEDPKFDEHMKGAQAAGLNCGTYWYSYALTVEDAYQEAEACYQIIKDYDFTYPVYFDIEDPSQKYLSTAQVSAIIEAFCSTLQAKGYYVGLYSYASFLNTRVLDSVLDKYDVWVAHFGVSKPDYGKEYEMWQYSSTGTVSGISGEVDLDYSYINYPYIISPDTYVLPGDEPAYTPPVVTQPAPKSSVVANGIDVSVWQGEVDWKQVASTGTDYAIIRAGYGRYASQKDKYFDANIKGAKAAGLDVGVYWYSYAESPADAVKEAEACYSVIAGQKLEYPVYFDLEDPSITGKSNSELTAIAEAFCSYLESKGYYVGIASYSNFLNTKLNAEVFDKYDVWVASYGVSNPAFSRNYGMWQYANDGKVKGINGSVDLDYSYLDFPSLMNQFHLNGY